MLCEGGAGGIEGTAVTPSQETEKIKESPEKQVESKEPAEAPQKSEASKESPEKPPETKEAEASPEKPPETEKAEASPEKPPETKELQESPEKQAEVVEAAEELRVIVETPEVKVEQGDIQAAEDLETAFVEAVPDKEEVSATPITLPKEDPDEIKDPADEVSATTITLTKEDPDTSGQMMEGEEEPVQGMVGDSLLMEEEEEPVEGRTTNQVMEEEDPVQGRDVSQVMEEEEPVQGRNVSEVMEVEEPIQGLTNPEIISQIMDQLPEGAESFTSQVAADIVESVMTGDSGDFLSPTRVAIQGEFQNLSPELTDGLLAVSFLKATQGLENLAGEMPDQPPGPDMGSGISPSYPGTDPADGSDVNTGGVMSSGDRPSDFSGRSENSDEQQNDMRYLQNKQNELTQMVTIMSNISRWGHELAKSVIQNYRA